jgi:hypothetical protein
MRNSVDWYNGSPVGTIQVFGAKEEQTTINGYWKDKFLTSPNRGTAPAELSQEITESISTGEEVSGLQSSALTLASDLVTAVDSIRRCGSEIEVTWLDKVRRGILERFSQKWHTGHDVEWEIMFTWSSQGESLDDVRVLDDTATDIGDVPNKVQSRLDDILSSAADVVQQADDRSSDVLQVFNDVSSKIAGLSDDLVDAVINVSAALSTPNEALLRVAGILDGIKLEAEDLWSIIQDQADGVMLDSGGVLGVVQRSFGEVLGVRADGRARADASSALGDLCAQQQQAMTSRLTSTVVRAFQARDGQDLRQVAQQFYGSSDGWRGLMVYNNLTGSGLRAGQVIFVPAQLPTGGC